MAHTSTAAPLIPRTPATSRRQHPYQASHTGKAGPGPSRHQRLGASEPHRRHHCEDRRVPLASSCPQRSVGLVPSLPLPFPALIASIENTFAKKDCPIPDRTSVDRFKATGARPSHPGAHSPQAAGDGILATGANQRFCSPAILQVRCSPASHALPGK